MERLLSPAEAVGAALMRDFGEHRLTNISLDGAKVGVCFQRISK